MKEIDNKYTKQDKKIKAVLEKEEMDNKMKEFFQEEEYEKIVIKNDIQYNREAFIGYNLSKSYSLRKTDENYEKYVKAFEELFEKYQKNEIINISNYVCGYLGEV